FDTPHTITVKALHSRTITFAGKSVLFAEWAVMTLGL
ncbi:unnamed protein product, partial [marine sediment metagenome]